MNKDAYKNITRRFRGLLGLGALAVLLFSLQACQNVKFEGLARPLDKSFQQRFSDHADR